MLLKIIIAFSKLFSVLFFSLGFLEGLDVVVFHMNFPLLFDLSKIFLHRYKAVYEKFRILFTQETEMQVQKFISRERPLHEYVNNIEKYKAMASEVGSLPVYIPMFFFLLDCTSLNQVSSGLYTLYIQNHNFNITYHILKYNNQLCIGTTVGLQSNTAQALKKPMSTLIKIIFHKLYKLLFVMDLLFS